MKLVMVLMVAGGGPWTTKQLNSRRVNYLFQWRVTDPVKNLEVKMQ